jgi:hypothetical protein
MGENCSKFDESFEQINDKGLKWENNKKFLLRYLEYGSSLLKIKLIKRYD